MTPDGECALFPPGVDRDVGRNDVLGLEGRLYQDEIERSRFDAAWTAVVRGTPSIEALALTTSGGEPDENGVTVLAGLAIVIPTPLTVGAVYPISRTIVPPSGMPLYWRIWGPRELVTPGQAEISLRVFDYHSIGMRVENEHIAQAAAGTVRVLKREGDEMTLRIDVTTTDAAGKQVMLRGDFTVNPERYTPPFS
ncbi:hypothetical protein BH23GEM9_BH23GEM9_28740 [soil metagenome]